MIEDLAHAQVAGGHELLSRIAAGQLSPSGRQQIGLYLRMLEVLEAELDALRARLAATTRRLAGAKVLASRQYGVGPITGLALTCWLGGKDRFSSARKAVRFCGLDVTVYSSAGKGSPLTAFLVRAYRCCARAPTRRARHM